MCHIMCGQDEVGVWVGSIVCCDAGGVLYPARSTKVYRDRVDLDFVHPLCKSSHLSPHFDSTGAKTHMPLHSYSL
jgi:hypothetical protein